MSSTRGSTEFRKVAIKVIQGSTNYLQLFLAINATCYTCDGGSHDLPLEWLELPHVVIDIATYGNSNSDRNIVPGNAPAWNAHYIVEQKDTGM